MPTHFTAGRFFWSDAALLILHAVQRPSKRFLRFVVVASRRDSRQVLTVRGRPVSILAWPQELVDVYPILGVDSLHRGTVVKGSRSQASSVRVKVDVSQSFLRHQPSEPRATTAKSAVQRRTRWTAPRSQQQATTLIPMPRDIANRDALSWASSPVSRETP